MKIQRYGIKRIKRGKNTVFIPKIVLDGYGDKFIREEDILPLLNPWKDAEKEKPDTNENVLCKTKDLDGKPLYQVGYYIDIEGYGWYLEHDLQVIAWMHIPKNEGEE